MEVALAVAVVSMPGGLSKELTTSDPRSRRLLPPLSGVRHAPVTSKMLYQNCTDAMSGISLTRTRNVSVTSPSAPVSTGVDTSSSVIRQPCFCAS